MNSILKIAVGSLNPVKIESARVGFATMFPDFEVQANGYSVASGVNDQPMSSQETIQGATNRAHALQQLDPSADFFVGIEGGIEPLDESFLASAWIVILDRAGNVVRGRTGAFPLPPKVKQLVESGIELGHANDQVFAQHNSKQAGGAVGSLTDGTITRQSLYEHAMILALIPFRQADLFELDAETPNGLT